MCNEILEPYSQYRTRGTHGRRVGLWALDSTAQSSPKILFALKILQDKMTTNLLEEALRMDLAEKLERLKKDQPLQDLTNTNERANALTNAKRLLDQAAKISKKA